MSQLGDPTPQEPTNQPSEAVEGEAVDPAVEGAATAPVPIDMDEVQAKGYFGDREDPTPHEAYSVSGVISGQATPETDADAWDAAHAHQLGNARNPLR